MTLHMRLRADLDRAIRDYADQHGSNVTNTVEAAIAEYLTTRGIHPNQEGTQ